MWITSRSTVALIGITLLATTQMGGITTDGSYQKLQLGYMPPGTTTIPSGGNTLVAFTPGPFEFLPHDTQGGTLLSTSTSFTAIDEDVLLIDISISGGVITITDIF